MTLNGTNNPQRGGLYRPSNRLTTDQVTTKLLPLISSYYHLLVVIRCLIYHALTPNYTVSA